MYGPGNQANTIDCSNTLDISLPAALISLNYTSRNKENMQNGGLQSQRMN
jgi:hypothetical protein